MRLATNVARDNLLSLGTCVGKFTKAGKFHLAVSALDLLAQYAKVSSKMTRCIEMSGASVLIKCSSSSSSLWRSVRSVITV